MKKELLKSLTDWLAPLKVPVRRGIRHDRLKSIVPGSSGRCVPYRYDEVSPPDCVTGVFVRGISFRGYAIWFTDEEFYGAIRCDSDIVEPTTFRGTALTLKERLERIIQVLGNLSELFSKSPWLLSDFPHEPRRPATKVFTSSNSHASVLLTESLNNE